MPSEVAELVKLKRLPTDFIVEEQTALEPGSSGSFAFYQLEKVGVGTPEAIQAICRKWKLHPRDVAVGGLKDRHAQTSQYLTIRNGPRRSLTQAHLRLRYLGQVATAYDSQQVTGNRFAIVLRDLDQKELDQAEVALAEVQKDGVPNYFDDQRFGSVGESRRFVARYLIDADYERALRLALAEPYSHDSAAVKQQKRLLREHWGDWHRLRDRLQGDAGRIVAYLAQHPDDYRGAFARLRADLKTLYLAAYQSHLWNRLLARWIEAHCAPEQLLVLRLRLGSFPAFRNLTAEQRERFDQQTLPLPSARLHLDPHDPIKPLLDEVLRQEDLELSQIKLKHFREPFFSKGDRAVLFHPRGLSWHHEADELHRGKRKLFLQFVLPRGCYATLLVKRIMLASPKQVRLSQEEAGE